MGQRQPITVQYCGVIDQSEARDSLSNPWLRDFDTNQYPVPATKHEPPPALVTSSQRSHDDDQCHVIKSILGQSHFYPHRPQPRTR